MCGIFGWVTRREDSPDIGLLRNLTDLMVHRGPDSSGYEMIDFVGGDYTAALGHRRLSIVDLSSAGAQPMWDASGRVCIIFNGEIYNHIELRAELETLGHCFRSSCDTEVLLESYRAWGEAAFLRFRGMFAFAILDLVRDVVILGRDPFGKKPLFLAEVAGGLVFSSEIEPILAFPGIPRAFDWGALEGYLLNRYVPEPATFFSKVRKLRSGCWLKWSAGKTSVTRYFSPPLSTTDPDIEDFDEAVDQFSAIFDDAVRLRLRSDAPFGAFLSGGLDSSAVVATMARHMSTRVKTFSVGFHEDSYSEAPFAEAVAKEFATDHSALYVSADDFFEAWDEAVLRRGAPVTEASDIVIMLLSKFAGKSVKMVLTGEGADEFLAGYPKYSAEVYVNLYHRLVPAGVHQTVVSPLISRLPYESRRLKVLAKALGARDPVDRVRLWFGDMNSADVLDLMGEHYKGVMPDPFPFEIETGSPVRRTLFFDQASLLPDNSLERNDRMMMAGSVEGRMPFMDQDLAAFCARLPDRFLIRHNVGKRLLRAAMSRIIPKSVLDRPKNGFRVPINTWFRTSHQHVLRDLLLSEQSIVRSILNKTVLDRLVEEHIVGRQNHERPLWTLCNLEKFLRIYQPTL